MGFDFDFGHSKGSKMHFFLFLVPGSRKNGRRRERFQKYIFFFIDLESLPIVTANFDEYESKSARCP